MNKFLYIITIAGVALAFWLWNDTGFYILLVSLFCFNLSLYVSFKFRKQVVEAKTNVRRSAGVPSEQAKAKTAAYESLKKSDAFKRLKSRRKQ